MFFLSCVCYTFVHVCSFVHCGHLLGKGCPIGSRLWCLTVSLSLSHRYRGSGVVLDCIDSCSLLSYLPLNRPFNNGFKNEPTGTIGWQEGRDGQEIFGSACKLSQIRACR